MKAHLTVLVLYLLSIQGAWGSLPVQSREIQHILVSAGYQVAVDNDPPWQYDVINQGGGGVFIAQTPEAYYPPAAVNIRYHPETAVASDEMLAFARGVLEGTVKNFGSQVNAAEIKLSSARYGELEGYQGDFPGLVNGQKQDIRLFVARNVGGKAMTLIAFTLPGKMGHIEPAIERIWRHIRFLNKH